MKQYAIKCLDYYTKEKKQIIDDEEIKEVKKEIDHDINEVNEEGEKSNEIHFSTVNELENAENKEEFKKLSEDNPEIMIKNLGYNITSHKCNNLSLKSVKGLMTSKTPTAQRSKNISHPSPSKKISEIKERGTNKIREDLFDDSKVESVRVDTEVPNEEYLKA